MQTVPQSTRELNTFRPMPYNTVTLQQNQPTWGHTKPNMLRAEAGGRGDSTNTAVVDILFLAPRPEVPLSIGSMLTVLWKYTLMNWYKPIEPTQTRDHQPSAQPRASPSAP
jgi:hypothetical protein